MDRTTQQNAALVEQMAAVASSLKSQGQKVGGAAAVFRPLQGCGIGIAQHHASEIRSKAGADRQTRS